MTVHSYLVTGDQDQKWDAWLPTAAFANWIEGRANGDDRETWLVTCMDEHAGFFISSARAAGATVQEIDGAGDSETYTLITGAPGSGWTP